MATLSRVWAVSASLALAGTLVACGSNDAADDASADGAATTTSSATDPGTPAPTEDSASPSDDATGSVTVTTAETELGTILVDGDGMTLYLFTNDSPGVSTCEDACLAAWPPLLGTPTPGEGADDSKLGTLVRSDGSTQVSYNGWPLYYWAGDTAPGDVAGQGVNGVWWVVDRDGEAVGAP